MKFVGLGVIWCLLLVALITDVQTREGVKPRSRRARKNMYRAKLLEVQHQIVSDPELRAEWDEQVTRSQAKTSVIWDPPRPTFTCDTTNRSTTRPTTVHELRPSDIDVVIAMGDSITAGNGVGAENAPQVALENRGQSWSIGGEFDLETVTTLPNILKKFNPNLQGASVCKSQETNAMKSFMNLAEPGGDNKDMDNQAEWIVERCWSDSRVDCQNDWKIVTLLIGGNDMCGGCDDMADFNATGYAQGIQLGLDILFAGIPRTFVNLVPMFDVTPLTNMTNGRRLCELLHAGFCECVYLFKDQMKDLQLSYYRELEKLVDSGRYERDDFTVVIQPMFVNSTPPVDPESGEYYEDFLSYDCFHPSLKAHESFAYSLWNTMLIPVGQKPDFWPTDEPDPTFYCPTEDQPYIFTKENSQVPAKR